MQYGYFNTASGIIQKQSFLMVATIAFIALFQYRKRYGPVATLDKMHDSMVFDNWFQYRKRYGPVATKYAGGIIRFDRFQYRKRYGPVATHVYGQY